MKANIRPKENNPDRWDATKCDYYLFYQYPWFIEKLEKDKQNPPNNVNKRWTEYEKQQFEYLKKRGFTHREIAEKLGKTKGAIDHMSRLRNIKEAHNGTCIYQSDQGQVPATDCDC